MFEHGFPKHWSTLKKLIYLKGAGIIGGASAVWKTVTGTLIHITDALASPMQKCEVSLEPIQDLHGQDAPYPAGGGVNKLKTGGLTYSAPSSTIFSNATPRTFASNSYCIGLTANNYYQDGRTLDVTVSENLVQFTTNAPAYGISIPVVGLAIGETYTFNATTENGYIDVGFYKEDGTFISSTGASHNSAFSFVIPAETYWAALSFQGKTADVQSKFTDIQLELGSSATPYKPYSNICPITGWTGCEVTRTGKNLVSKVVNCYFYGNASHPTMDYASESAVFYAVEGTQYVRSSNPAPTRSSIALADSSEITANTNLSNAHTMSPEGATTWVAEWTGWTVWYFYPSHSTSVEETAQVEIGTEATDYELYSGTTLSVTFPDGQTVYGGKYEFVSGNLKPYKEYDSYNGETLTGEWMSSIDKYVAGTTPTIGAQVVDLDGYDTTVQLTPQPISTLVGENNVWSNGNSVEITYKAQA